MVLFAAKIFGIPYGLLFSGPSPLTLERLRDLEFMVSGILIVSTFEKLDLIWQRLSAAHRKADSPGAARAAIGRGRLVDGRARVTRGRGSAGPRYGRRTICTPPSFWTRIEYVPERTSSPALSIRLRSISTCTVLTPGCVPSPCSKRRYSCSEMPGGLSR